VPPLADRPDAGLHRERQQAAGGELPHAGGREEVRAGRVRLRRPQAVDQRAQRDDEHDAADGEAAHPLAAAPGEPRGADEQHRPDEVELLLDRERPEVLDGGRGRLGGEVVDLRERQHPVLDVARAGEDLLRRCRPLVVREQQHDRDADDEQHEHRRRQQAAGPADVEPPQPEPVAVDVADDVTGDEEPGDHEEDVDADVAARHPVRPDVEGEDEQDGDGAQRLDLRRPRGPAVPGDAGRRGAVCRGRAGARGGGP
jgi:hypothetical protein